MTDLSVLFLSFLAAGEAPKEVDYLREVKPIFAARCFACHGAIKQKGGLRVDTGLSLREGGDKGAAIVPGKGKDSLLVKRVLGRDGLKRMPPEHEGEALKPAEVERIIRWIDQGAVSPKEERPETDPAEHWAFKKPVRPPLPKVKNGAWAHHPIDAFLALEHEKQGLTGQPPAEKRLLLRRVTLDLIGMPPSAAEIDAFLKDAAPDAWEKVVDRLLASPQYGERWGRHWMDIWRYSDWWGLGAELRNSQKHIWHWRDWIVESLNKDKGYDRMVLEMLAADELYPTNDNALRGTGFLARHYFKFNRTTWLDETIEHTSKAFLGLTMNCSKCHDHKYDPITQVDYYRFRAFFEPYQIRTDQVPGEADFEKDGIPRVFDSNLDAPTFLHLRGNESDPDKTRKITPGLPTLLAAKGLLIREITLPTEAHHPGLRPFVLEDQLKRAEKQREAARLLLAKAREQLALAEKKGEEAKIIPKEEGKVLVQDDFTVINKERWTVGPGQWEIEGGKVVQKQEGEMRGLLSLREEAPVDFEARFQFTPLSGKEYKSVGIAFDVDKDHEALVYLTAHVPDPRVQVAYKSKRAYVYPPEARQTRKVALGTKQEIVIRVRGSLLNVLVNGEQALAYVLPAGRNPGRLDLVTYDAAARFESFTLATLPAGVEMVRAVGKKDGPVDVGQARAAVVVAEKQVGLHEAQIGALRARGVADLAGERETKMEKRKEVAGQAARAEKEQAVAEAELALAKAQEQLALGGPKADAAAVKKALAGVEAARKALAVPGETYTPLTGSLKTLESNLETEASRRKPFPKVSTGRRSALAQWIASQDNPLTARVAVNHLWTRHFGQPLVHTVFDLGRKGAAPTHPELLDWLAVELMEHDWSMKHIHRLMVTSRAYRMTSSLGDAPSAGKDKDPDNRFLWHMNPSRMESQVVRDSLLHLAGELDFTLGGPSLEVAQQETSKRRSLYFFHSAIDRNRFLATFDEADPLDCYRRRESIVPQQALALSNSKLALSMAQKMAQGLEKKLGKSTDEDFTKEAFALLLGLEPSAEERAACGKALERWRTIYPTDGGQRARMLLVHALLNHNDFVTVR